MHLSSQEWIEQLGLTPHLEEGGFYAQSYVSQFVLQQDHRPLVDVIYYMLTSDSPIGYFHKNSSDIVHFFHAGSSLRYTVIDPMGRVSVHYLGPDPTRDHVLQLVVPAGHWKSTELVAGEFGLLSEAVVPSFDPAGRTIATRGHLMKIFPGLDPLVLRLAYE